VIFIERIWALNAACLNNPAYIEKGAFSGWLKNGL
jgi:hypothetical protein